MCFLGNVGNAYMYPATKPTREGNAYVFKMCFFVFPRFSGILDF